MGRMGQGGLHYHSFPWHGVVRSAKNEEISAGDEQISLKKSFLSGQTVYADLKRKKQNNELRISLECKWKTPFIIVRD